MNGKKVKRLRREFIARYGRAPREALRPQYTPESLTAASAERLKKKDWERYGLTLPAVAIPSEVRALKKAARRANA